MHIYNVIVGEYQFVGSDHWCDLYYNGNSVAPVQRIGTFGTYAEAIGWVEQIRRMTWLRSKDAHRLRLVNRKRKRALLAMLSA